MFDETSSASKVKLFTVSRNKIKLFTCNCFTLECDQITMFVNKTQVTITNKKQMILE